MPDSPPEECSHLNSEQMRPFYVDGRPLYRCLDCGVRFTYEDDKPTFCGLAELKDTPE